MQRRRGARGAWLTGTGGLAAVALVAAGCGSSAAAGSLPPARANATGAMLHAATVKVAKESGLGKVLVNSAGHTLYLFTPDHQKKPTCSGACASAWPPLDVKGKPTGGSGVKSSLLGTVKGKNGKTQVTYNHWPLYTFADDSAAGQHNGEGLSSFGGTWYAISAAGKEVHVASSSATTTTTSGGGGW